MDINKTIAELKALPGFTDNVGMMLIHNGVVRGTQRGTKAKVSLVKVKPNYERMQEICSEFEAKEGIFKVVAVACEGDKKPGDDLLFLIVAGDIRENVKSCFAELLDKIKAESIVKQEIIA